MPPTEPSCVGLAMRAVRSFAEVAADSLLPCLSLDTEQSLPLLRYQPTTSQLAENLGIYQLLNVAAKFILLRGAGNGSKILYKLIRIYCTLIVLIISTLNLQFIASMFFSLGLRGCWYGEDPEYPERLCAMLSILYPSTLFLVIPCGLTAFMLAAALVLAAGSGFATMMALQLSNSWVNRFGSLRQLDVSSPVDPAETDDKNKAIFANLVSRDATESYLFQQAFMNQLGRKFNFILAAQVLISFVSLALNIVALLLDPNPEKTFVGKDAVVSVAMIMWVNLMYAYPICCIAHSNLAIDRLLDTVKASGMSDFSILGGRHEWIAFVNDNPCFWRILGVPFTYRTLGVAITSTIAPVLYLLLPGRWLALIGGGTEVAS